MKKIYTLIVGCLIGFASIAADREPVVTINANDNYEVKIDGRLYSNSGTTTLSQGSHSVEVYQVKKAFLGKRRILVSRNSFNLRDKDVQIDVDQNGESRIREARNSTNRKDRNFEDRRDDDTRNYDKKDKVKENNRERGRGHKYGHYKNKKQGKNDDKYDDR